MENPEINFVAKHNQKIEAIKRSGGVSEISGINGKVESSHVDHTKTDVEVYLDHETVVICTPFEHYVYHLMFKGNANLIGLQEHENDWAIDQTFVRGVEYLQKHRKIDFNCLSREQKTQLVAQAWNSWSYYLELPFFNEL